MPAWGSVPDKDGTQSWAGAQTGSPLPSCRWGGRAAGPHLGQVRGQQWGAGGGRARKPGGCSGPKPGSTQTILPPAMTSLFLTLPIAGAPLSRPSSSAVPQTGGPGRQELGDPTFPAPATRPAVFLGEQREVSGDFRDRVLPPAWPRPPSSHENRAQAGSCMPFIGLF